MYFLLKLVRQVFKCN